MKGKNVFSRMPIRPLLALAFILSTGLSLLVGPSSVEAQLGSSQTCNAMIKDYVNWARSSNNMVDSQFSGIAVKTRNPNARHEFGFGRWGFARLDVQGDNLHGYYQEYFSDRTNGRQPFDRQETDWLEVWITPNNGVIMKLLSWNDTVVRLSDLSCTANGFIMGRWPGATEQIVTIALVKTYR